MAFTRWSSSDLYIFPSDQMEKGPDGKWSKTGVGVMQCCGCPLTEEELNFEATTPRAFYDHLELHEAAGHKVAGGYRALIQAIDSEAHLWFGVGH